MTRTGTLVSSTISSHKATSTGSQLKNEKARIAKRIKTQLMVRMICTVWTPYVSLTG